MDLDVHIRVFKHRAKLKGFDSDESWIHWVFPSTLKDTAQKWYYHYPPAKLNTYAKLTKAFIIRFSDDNTDE